MLEEKRQKERQQQQFEEERQKRMETSAPIDMFLTRGKEFSMINWV